MRRTTRWNAYFLDEVGDTIGTRTVMAVNRSEAEEKALALTKSEVSPLKDTKYLHLEQTTIDMMVVEV